MFTLLSEENRKQLVKGTIVLKYPVDGMPSTTPPLTANDENSILYRIAAIQDNEQTSLEFPPLPPTEIASLIFSRGNLHKLVSAMIEYRTWWIYTPDT